MGKMALSLDDLGVRQGVTAVERLRTYGQKVFAPERYAKRWATTTSSLHIDDVPQGSEFVERIQATLDRNSEFLHRQADVAITVVATPGVATAKKPTFAITVSEIDHASVIARRESGQTLVVTDVVQPPAESWPRNIKVRSRIHYYLADRQARQVDPTAAGVLIDHDHSVTETSICNLAIVKDGVIVSPPESQVLPGVTQAVVEELAADEGLEWRRKPLMPRDLLNADEILMTGTTTGIWFANRVDFGRDHSIFQPKAMDVYRRLLRRFVANAG